MLALAAGAQARVSPAQVDAASRLAMLSERIAKLHAQLGREVLVVRSRRALTAAAAEFDRGLAEASATPPTPEIRENYLILKHLWTGYRAAALQAPTPDLGRKLAERNDEVAWIAAKGARLLAAQDRSRATELVMAAGAARAAAQRLAKIYLQRGWAFPAGALEPESEAARKELREGLRIAQAARETGEAIALELRAAEAQLGFLRNAAERRDLEHIAKSADNIAEALDRVTRAYAGTTSAAPD